MRVSRYSRSYRARFYRPRAADEAEEVKTGTGRGGGVSLAYDEDDEDDDDFSGEGPSLLYELVTKKFICSHVSTLAHISLDNIFL